MAIAPIPTPANDSSTPPVANATPLVLPKETTPPAPTPAVVKTPAATPTESPSAPTNTQAVVTSGAAQQAVTQAQRKLATATNNQQTAAATPAPPVSKYSAAATPPADTGNTGSGSSGSGASATPPNYGITVDTSKGPQGTMPANPTDGQQANDVNGTSWTYSQSAGSWKPSSTAGSAAAGSGSATGTGTTTLIPGTNIPSTGNPGTDAIIKSYSDGITAFNSKISDIANQLETMRAQMDTANQTLLTQIGASFDAQVSAAQAVNNAKMAGMTQAGIRSGLSRYAPDIYEGNIADIMDTGLAKISDILTKKATALSKAQVANEKEDYTTLYQEMQNYEKNQTAEQTQTLNLLKQIQSNQKLVDSESKQQLQDQKTQQQIEDTQTKDYAYAVLSALDADAGVKGESTLAEDTKMVQEYASLYGLDPQKLLSQVETLKNTKDSYGSGTIGQYRFYADFETSQGRTPLSFTNWQAELAGAKAQATAAGKKAGEGTGTGAGSLESIVTGIGLPVSTYTSSGKMSKAALQKVITAGVSDADAQGIWANIAAGNSLEDIRQGMRANGQDPSILDKFMTALQG